MLYHFGYILNVNMEWSIKYYYTPDGKVPFKDWMDGLGDKTTEDKIDAYITRLMTGNFNNCKPIQGVKGIYEIVMDFGPGYRAYYARVGKVILLIVCGGLKNKQKGDIETAVKYRDDALKRIQAGIFEGIKPEGKDEKDKK
jgi:putative addiction module killer protein